MNLSFSNIFQHAGPNFTKCQFWGMFALSVVVFFIIFSVYGGLLAFFLLCIVILAILYRAQDHLLYHPEDSFHSRTFVQIPHVVGLPYESIHLRSIDGTLIHLYFIRQREEEAPNAPTIVFLHGNAGNMGHRLHNAAALFRQLHCNLLMVEYRGYGLSQGRPSEHGLSMDARTAIDYLTARRDVNHRQIIVFGRSLGGAVAIDLVARAEYAAKVWCVILENTFTSIPEMAQALFQWQCLKSVPLYFYKNKYLSRHKVTQISIPVLFISGLNDSLVPPDMMTELHSRCSSPFKQIVHIETGTHNDTWTCPGYYTSIANFLAAAQDYQPDPPVLESPVKDV